MVAAYVQSPRVILAILVLLTCCRIRGNEDGVFDYQVSFQHKSVAKAKVIQLILDLAFENDSISRVQGKHSSEPIA